MYQPNGFGQPQMIDMGAITPYSPSTPGLGQGYQMPDYGPQEHEIADIWDEIQRKRMGGFSQPAPQMGTGANNWGLLIGAALAALDPSGRAGQTIAGGFQQNAQRNYQNALAEYQRRQQENEYAVEGLGQKAKFLEGSLGRQMDRDQNAATLAQRDRDFEAEQSRFNQTRADRQREYEGEVLRDYAKGVESKRQFNITENNKLKAIGLRGDEKQQENDWKTLNSEKSTRAARSGAIDRLSALGHRFSPQQIAEYLQSTYYEDNQTAKTQYTRGKNSREERELPGKIDARAAQAQAARSRAALNEKITSTWDAKTADQFRKTDAYIQNVVGSLADKAEGRRLQQRGQDVQAYREGMKAASAQANAIRRAKSVIEKGLPKMDDAAKAQAMDQIRNYDAALQGYKNDYANMRDALEAAKADAANASNPNLIRPPTITIPQGVIGSDAPKGRSQMKGGTLPRDPGPPPSPTRQAPTKPGNARAAQLRSQAQAAIKAGADPAKVKARLQAELKKLGG